MSAFNALYLKETFKKFGTYVVQQSRANLTKKKKNSSGALYDSLGYEFTGSESGASFSFDFLMEEYGEYIDKGVSGVQKKYNTPYSYKNKYPPRGPLDKWAVRKGIQGIRGKDGKFISRKSLVFLIQRKLYYKGIEPSYFFSRAFQLGFNRLPSEVRESFKLDVEQFMRFTLKNIFG